MRRRFSFSSLVSPAMLFALAAILIGLPGLQRLAAPRSAPRMELRVLRPPRTGGGTLIVQRTIEPAQLSTVQSFSFASPTGVVLFASLPLFALTYALWPRALGRALRPDLGRWHAAFAIVPTLLAPALVFLVFVLLSPLAIHAAASNPRGFVPAMAAWSTTFIASLRYAIGILWLTGVAIFSVNVAYTLHRRGEAGS